MLNGLYSHYFHRSLQSMRTIYRNLRLSSITNDVQVLTAMVNKSFSHRDSDMDSRVVFEDRLLTSTMGTLHLTLFFPSPEAHTSVSLNISRRLAFVFTTNPVESISN